MSVEFPDLQIRPAVAEDRNAIIELVDRVYREYGDQVFIEGADADLLGVPEVYEEAGGAFIVLTDGQQIVGSHGVMPLAQQMGACTFRRLYLRSDFRGSGVGKRLMNWALDWAKQTGQRRVEFWSDVRFTRAHPFFESIGFQRDGRVRELNDGAMPYREYFFYLDL